MKLGVNEMTTTTAIRKGLKTIANSEEEKKKNFPKVGKAQFGQKTIEKRRIS